MKHLLTLFCLVFCNLWANAQLFTGSGGKIADNKHLYAVDSFPIKVTGLPNLIDAEFGISKICLNIIHPKTSDLKIELLSPDGTSIWLSNRNGGDDGSGYFSTCFRSNGLSGYIHQGKAPFSGEFIPDGRIPFLNNGQNPNGTWYLLIQDLRPENAGSLSSVSIQFEKNPTPGLGQAPCRLDNGAGCKCPDGSDNCDLLPDLIVMPAFTKQQVKEYAHDDTEYPGQLRFAVSIANIGDGPIETYGNNTWFCGENAVADSSVICDDGTHARQKVFQKIYRKNANTLLSTDRLAGTNYYEDLPGHNHYHTDDWVEFRLMQKDKKGKSKRIAMAKGRKVSFCLFDSGICNNSDELCAFKGKVYGEKTLPNYGLGNYVDCNNPAASQGISVGAYDTYGLHFEGQHIQLPPGLKSGTYYLEIEIDPTGIYLEKDKTNNLFSLPVQITRQEIK